MSRGISIAVSTCQACGGHYVASQPKCPACGKTSGNGHPTAMDTDPPIDQITAEHTPLASEAQIAGIVEEWLTRNGWWPRDDKHLDGTAPPRGWWIHNRLCEGNFYMLDYLVLDFGRGWYEFELKTKTGRIRKVQTLIMQAEPHHCALHRDAQDAIDAIRQRFDMA